MSIEVSPIGDVIVPDDLGAPFSCDCGEWWWATIEDVASAAAGIAPLVSPCCDRRYRVGDLGAIAFFSRAEWAAASDDAPPDPYRVGLAFHEPRSAA